MAATNCVGQLITFNKTYGEPNLLEVGDGCEIIGQGYAMALSTSVLNKDSTFLKIINMNQLGDTILVKQYSETGKVIMPSRMKQMRDSMLLTTCFERTANTNIGNAHLFFTDLNADTLFTKYVTSNLNRTVLIDFCQTYSKEFLFTGFAQNLSGNTLLQSQLYIVKTDSLGNKLWDTLVGNNVDWEEGRGIVELEDSSFVIAGYRYKTASGLYEGMCLKIDKNNELIWSNNYVNGNSSFSGLLKMKNEQIILYGGKVISIGPPLDGDILMTKIDTGGNVQWSKT